ncbi:Transposon Tf2-9 poly [Paramuricea clavata]|uniref:Transposon Tf2-9 poly n=1 Tax=Paramuricea clavata TaxID=317549 RepID=A0A7D9JCA2_PARCT|nr:Transposon Tf2-9 poly [Paramuricea clavata]
MCRSRQRNNIPEKRRTFKPFVVTPPVENEVPPNARAVKTIPVIIERTHVKMIVDTGATTNILDSKAYNDIKKKNPSLHLKPSTHKIYAYMQSKPLPVLGKFEGLIESKHRMAVTTFHVVNGDGGSLLLSRSYTDPREDHKQFGNENPEIPKNHQPDSPIMSKLKKEYPSVFNGIGKLKEGTPTPFVSNLVVAPKPNNPAEVRVCIDMRHMNPMIERKRHVIPNIGELFEDMAGATMFSKVDLTAEFHQLPLDEESRSLTTFHTHKGLMRYKRLCFGVNSAPEQFQYAIQQTLQGLEGVRNIADDIIVWGKSQKEHDTHLEALMKRLSENNLTLNVSKCKFNVDSIWFYGCTLSKYGISADKTKIAALVNMKEPEDVSQLRSFLGLATYCERFINNLATIAAPLRELTNKGVVWKWTGRHQQGFNKVKEEIAKDCTTAFYDPSKRTRVTVDASPV